MNTPDQQPPSGSSDKVNDPAPESPQGAGPLADLQRMLAEIRAIGVRLFADVSALALAQWRLTSYVMRGTLSIWTICLRIELTIWVLALISIVFLNVAVWSFVLELSGYPPAAPLALVLMNGGSAVALHFWRKGIKLR